ncbi:MAG TPA: HAMP domain-containing sensor histidine kinase [Candidatus Eremiobacteraceae bacterium]|nr:HAMP domain-containing sensor histidine kinase [Candidatus Eremiobacteraceae bacterium]
MNNRIWSSAVALAFAAAIMALLVYFAVNLGYGFALRETTIDANLRSQLAEEIIAVSQAPAAKRATKKQMADEIVAAVRSVHGYDAAVVGDDGKVLAGDAALAAANPLPPPSSMRVAQPGVPGGPGPSGPRPGGPPGPGAPPGSFGPQVFGAGPQAAGPAPRPGARSVIFTFHRPGFGPSGADAWHAPVSLVHIDGASVIFTRTTDTAADVLSRTRWIAFGLAALAFAITLLLGRRLLRATTRPFEVVRAALTRLGQGDYSRLSAADPDDPVVHQLVEEYNAAASEVAGTVAARQEVENNIRRFVADAGHELRTPLAVITGYVDLLRHASSEDNVMERRIFAEIDGQGERMRALIQNLLFLLRLDSQEPSDVKIIDAADVVQGVIDSFKSLANGATLGAEVEPGSFVQVSETELRQAIGNLIDNSLKYAPGSHIAARVRSEGDQVIITVSDDGPGMSPDTRARAFERFARGDTSGSIPGSGLGLAIVARTTERAGGSVSLHTEPGKGATVEMRFPAWKPRTSQTPA